MVLKVEIHGHWTFLAGLVLDALKPPKAFAKRFQGFLMGLVDYLLDGYLNGYCDSYCDSYFDI